MADAQRVSVNEPTPAETVSLEERHAQLEEQGVFGSDGESPDVEETVAEEKPEWLPDKFENPEELAKAYSELEKRQSGGEEEEGEVSELSETDTVLQSATAEYTENGGLSEDTFKSLADNGFPEDLVKSYIAGQEAIANTHTHEIQQAVGGSQNYDEITAWAAEALPDAEIDAYNALLASGTIDQAKIAAKGLHAQFQAASSPGQRLKQGSTSGSAIAPFGSAAQVTEAMRDRRYLNDPAVRKTVEKRLAVSDVL